MSMKRTKPSSPSRGRDSGTEYATLTETSKPTAPLWNWAEMVKRKPDTIFQSYDLAGFYAKGAFIRHPKFGKGLVTSVDGYRLEILFEEGIKKLGQGQA